MTLLPEDFVPGDNDVICGRGKKAYKSVGNERFRQRVAQMLDEYAKAKSKLDKSGVLATVVDQIRALSPEGGFVKQNEEGRWYEVGDFLAREKTSQAFRDALHERYKSSNVAKKKKRQEEQARASDKFQRIARSYSDTPTRLDWLGLSGEMRGGHAGRHPGAYDIYRGNSYGAAMRLNRLTDMQQRLNRRFQPTRGAPAPRPNSAMGIRFPDPLFGQAEAANAFPSSEGYPGEMRHAYSMPASPRHEPDELLSSFGEIDLQDLARPTHEELAYEREQEAMHHSMPNIHISSNFDFDLNVEQSLHHSAPDLRYSDGVAELADASLSSDIEPIPLDEITPRPASKKAVSGDDFKKAISMTLSPTSPSAEVVSRDLIACLEKLNGSTIKEDNPFDPIPLEEEGTEEPLDAYRVSRDRKPAALD